MFDAIIAGAASKWSVPEEWISAVIQTESSGNPMAFNPNDPGGARGLMQITAPTARSYGVVDLNKLFDPAYNIEVGTHLLHDLISRYGMDFRRVYSAYNSGNPDLWQTSSEVAANVARALSNLSPAAAGGAGLILIAAAIYFFMKRKK